MSVKRILADQVPAEVYKMQILQNLQPVCLEKVPVLSRPAHTALGYCRLFVVWETEILCPAKNRPIAPLATTVHSSGLFARTL